jgi:hypothetical protein
MSGSFLALVLAMALLGPAPAAAIGCVSVLADDLARRRTLRDTLWNAMTFVSFPLAGGWIIRLATEGATFGGADALGFAALVGLVYMVMNATNFGSVALYLNLTRGMRFRDSWQAVYVTVLPFEFATALLTAAVAFSYSRIGVGAAERGPLGGEPGDPAAGQREADERHRVPQRVAQRAPAREVVGKHRHAADRRGRSRPEQRHRQHQREERAGHAHAAQLDRQRLAADREHQQQRHEVHGLPVGGPRGQHRGHDADGEHGQLSEQDYARSIQTSPILGTSGLGLDLVTAVISCLSGG